ncbi:MAG: amino acid processing protein [Firmicutes bacterium]|mgnify:CR=1 FL=1|jgi:D-serine deaminase-like pyridoxal phosphate-dependent protein|nr:amino acid processing protein [Bacillota bacterium]
MTTKWDLPSPALVADLDCVERNLERVAYLARQNGVSLRPHIKPHKSVYFARKQIESGAKGITCAKLAEAEVMAEHGFDDILIAYTLLGQEKLDRLKRLHERIRIITIADSLTVARGLASVGTREHPLPVLIEIDTGTHRGGRQPGEDALGFARELSQFDTLSLKGIFTYGGRPHSLERQDLETKARAETELLRQTAALLKKNGFTMEVISSGSTPSTFVLDQLKGVTEIRPGNYIFFDRAALALGIAEENDCALRVLATVVSVPLPGYATIDAGSKTLSSDPAYLGEGFGQLVGMPDVELVKLNEEHGYLRFNPATRELEVGDRVEVIPNHACVLPNLSGVIYGVRGDWLEKEIPVEARGKNY